MMDGNWQARFQDGDLEWLGSIHCNGDYVHRKSHFIALVFSHIHEVMV